MKDAKTKKTKAAKYISFATNILTVIICVFAVIVAISTITSKNKGYVNIMGYAYYSVATGSMEGSNKDSFSQGDVIRVKILKDGQKDSLKENQVITFIDATIKVNGIPQPNTHRIVGVERVADPDGNIRVFYRTKGDANDSPDPVLRASDEVIGVMVGKSNAIGKAFLWMQTKDGFLVCVVVPSILIFIYCFAMVIVNLIAYNKKKILLATEEKQAELESEIEAKLREKILRELQASADGKAEDKNKEKG